MEEIVLTHIAAISHVPHSVRPLPEEVLPCKLHNAHSKGVSGTVCLILFAKVDLHHPPVARF